MPRVTTDKHSRYGNSGEVLVPGRNPILSRMHKMKMQISADKQTPNEFEKWASNNLFEQAGFNSSWTLEDVQPKADGKLKATLVFNRTTPEASNVGRMGELRLSNVVLSHDAEEQLLRMEKNGVRATLPFQRALWCAVGKVCADLPPDDILEQVYGYVRGDGDADDGVQ